MKLTRRRTLQGAAALALNACAGAPRRERTDVLIVGAGLAGLHAAANLRWAGARVIVLEAGTRAGGRAFTGRMLPDRPEFGGIQVGDTYAAFRGTASRFNIAIDAFPHPVAAPAFAVGDTLITASEWERSPANPLKGNERAISPARLLGHFVAGRNPLTTLSDWSSPATPDVSVLSALQTAGASPEAIRIIEGISNNNGLAESSVINEWRSQRLRAIATRSDVVLDGTDALTSAMATALGDGLWLGSTVAGLEQDKTRVYARLGNGSTVSAERAIVCVPPAALGRIAFSPVLPPAHADALAHLAYTSISLAFVDTDAFWEQDGSPPHMWTDGALERWFPRIDAASGEIVGFKIWLNGAGARRADTLGEQQVEQLVSSELRRLRPASGGRCRLARYVSWQRDGRNAGAYPDWPAGQVASLAARVGAAHGRIHFAGDYTSAAMTGMEGAMESATRAVSEIA